MLVSISLNNILLIKLLMATTKKKLISNYFYKIITILICNQWWPFINKIIRHGTHGKCETSKNMGIERIYK